MYHRRTLLKLLRFGMFRFKPILVYHSSRLVYFIKFEAKIKSSFSSNVDFTFLPSNRTLRIMKRMNFQKCSLSNLETAEENPVLLLIRVKQTTIKVSV